MDFFKRYPMMTPYEGTNFHDRNKPSLLLVGESHYLLDGSKQHLTPASWYGRTHETLDSEETLWINTPVIVASACESNFRNRAHWIWKNAFEVINDAGSKYDEAREIGNDVAFLNFFLRPAPTTGGSLAWHVTDEDLQLANEAFAIHSERLAPTAIVFISRLARRCFQPLVPPTIPVIATPHPTSQWWNRESKRYGNRRGRDILAEFVTSLAWPKSPARPE